MNTYNINDTNFINSSEYQEFIKNNPEVGFLKIRAFAASGAIPISNMKVVVSKNVNNDNVIFYEGYTNSSGIIERITLPAPRLEVNNMNAPSRTSYLITATYSNNIKTYEINIYENVSVIQNINITPTMERGSDTIWL